MSTAPWQQRLTTYFYPRAKGWIDGTEEFHALCRSVAMKGAKILEIGAGPSNPTSRFLATLGEVHGLDLDPAVQSNDALKTAAVTADASLPFASGSFDLCISNYVLEHIADPEAHLSEVARVLNPGGAYLFRTPNRFHYVSLVSSITPHWFHEKMANRLRNLPSDAHDPYPTVYALNSRFAIRRSARMAGLDVEQLRLIEKEPSYGMSSPFLFLAFTAYERLVNASEWLSDLRANILAVLRKPNLPGLLRG